MLLLLLQKDLLMQRQAVHIIEQNVVEGNPLVLPALLLVSCKLSQGTHLEKQQVLLV